MKQPRLSAALLALLAVAALIQSVAAKQPAASQEPDRKSQQPSRPTLVVKIVDETGVAIVNARLTLLNRETRTARKSESDHTGQSQFVDTSPGVYELLVEKEGFYAVTINDVRLAEALNLEITLSHVQEFAEQVTVVDSTKSIDPEKTGAVEGLGYREIINLPYPSTRDYRNALTLVPGVLQDNAGRFHVAGSSAYQTFDQLDGFNITHPVTGLLELRVSTDALRRIDVHTSGYSAELGKGSGGVLSLSTGMGDDRYRFSATNFIPSVQNRKGLHLDGWTPRATFSGPLRRKSAWFFNAADGEYNLNIIEELPAGSDRNSIWRVGNLLKAQINLTQTNILTGSFIINRSRSARAGLSRFNPIETTVDQDRSAFLLTLKDQAYLSNGWLLEVGLAAIRFRNDNQPMGESDFVITPEGARGNSFETSRGLARRFQSIASLTLPAFRRIGQHQVKLGVDIDRISYDQSLSRRRIFVLREGGTLARIISFSGRSAFETTNSEASGFVQDRWNLSTRLLLEAGIRVDWDQIVRRASPSPRVAGTYLVTSDGHTKLSARAGIFHDATNLEFITRPLAGERIDSFFELDGHTLREMVETSFRVNQGKLKTPRFVNWGVGLERKLPRSIYLNIDYLRKRGRDGFAFVDSTADRSNLLELQNVRRDRFDSLQITARRSFKDGYSLLGSYTRSSARSSAVNDFDLNNPIITKQADGPLSWDAPNRFLTWGWLPLVKGFTASYSLDWRDGYPFSLVNQEQQLVGEPNSQRFPSYFSLNIHIEKRVHLFGVQWALRAGVNNLTDRKNPTAVNNNIDSPQFLTFGGQQHRVFTARIRFLGRK